MANEIKIVVTSEDKTKLDAITKKFGAMREMGEKVSAIGMRMSAAFTAPVLGLGALLTKTGADAAATIAELDKALADAIKSKDADAIKAAKAALAAVTPAVREAAAAYGQLQAAIAPIKAEFDKIIAQLMTALVPLLKELTPVIMDIVKQIGGMVKAFAALDTPQKENILKWVLFGMALGPVIVLVGQMIWMVGTLGTLLPGLAAGIWAVVAPLVAVAAAIYAIIQLFQMEEMKQLIALTSGGMVETFTGSAAKGNATTKKAYAEMGGGGNKQIGDTIRGLVSAPSGGVSGGNTTVINYAPLITTADAYAAIQALKPIVEQINRQGNGR
jgi:hypothetical protein